LVRDRKKKLAMQPVRRLGIDVDAVLRFKRDDLHLRCKNAHEFKKITSRKLLQEKDTSDCFYQLTMGSTDHSLLMSCSPDVHHFLVVGPTNSTLDLEALATNIRYMKISEQLEIKNTFLTLNESSGMQAEGRQRSSSDTDLHRLSNDLGDPVFGNDNVSGPSSKITSNSGTSTSLSISAMNSEVSEPSGGSVSQVRLGTHAVLGQDGRFVTQGTSVIHFSDFSKLPIDASGIRLSAASVVHEDEGRGPNCRKCAFFSKVPIKSAKMCKSGALCDFCHGSHKRPFIHKRGK